MLVLIWAPMFWCLSLISWELRLIFCSTESFSHFPKRFNRIFLNTMSWLSFWICDFLYLNAVWLESEAAQRHKDHPCLFWARSKVTHFVSWNLFIILFCTVTDQFNIETSFFKSMSLCWNPFLFSINLLIIYELLY